MSFFTNNVLVRKIASKLATIGVKKITNCETAVIGFDDLVFEKDGDKVRIHLRGDLVVNEDEFLKFIDNSIKD